MKNNININRIIAKIDNDFSPDNSDWIPRVCMWVVDAMNMLNVTPKETKRIKVKIINKFGYLDCPIQDNNIKVFDKNNCEIKELKSPSCCSTNSSFIGSIPNENSEFFIKNYVLIGCNKIELNFNTDYIYIEYNVIKTFMDESFGCELPVIPNNGLLIEAVAYYCMYKMLTRGYKHPVFNLAASQYGTNPYWEWNKLKDEAKRSVIISKQGEVLEDGGIWQSSFLINTFNPR